MSTSRAQRSGSVPRRPFRVRAAGGFLDAIGGGGWGPIVTSTLIARGDHPRQSIGSVSNLAALAQSDVKRILAFSSVSHAGFMLIAIAAASERGTEALLFYLVPYAAMSVGAFAVVAARERELDKPVTLEGLAGLGWERPFYGVALWIFMLGMAGFPLTGGFFGKLFVFSAAYEAGDWWLVLVGVAATALSLAYYLNIVRWLYMRSGAELRLVPAGGSPPRELALGVAVTAAVVVTVGSFFAAQPILDLASDAATSLSF